MNLEDLAKNLNLYRIKIRGDEIHASCPFTEKHLGGKDSRPSFSINISKGVYNCFSCGSKGTLEELVSEVKSISIAEAISRLDSWGFSLLDRKLRESAEEDCGYRYISDGLLFYYEKVEDDFAEIYSGDIDGNDCIIYPVRDIDGRLVGGLARSKEGKWHKVLWNLRKSSYLYGEEFVDREKEIVITEGPGDVISLRKSGIKNAVALMGVSASDEQIEKLLSLSSNFVVWLDKDQSGAKGMNILWKKLENRAIVKYVDPWKVDAIKPKGDAKQVYEDYGKDKVVEIVNNAKTYLEHIMEDNFGK